MAVVSIALCFTRYFRVGNVLGELGRQGGTWFEHPGDRDLADAPAEDAVDAPIPHRPLRARY